MEHSNEAAFSSQDTRSRSHVLGPFGRHLAVGKCGDRARFDRRRVLSQEQRPLFHHRLAGRSKRARCGGIVRLCAHRTRVLGLVEVSRRAARRGSRSHALFQPILIGPRLHLEPERHHCNLLGDRYRRHLGSSELREVAAARSKLKRHRSAASP